MSFISLTCSLLFMSCVFLNKVPQTRSAVIAMTIFVPGHFIDVTSFQGEIALAFGDLLRKLWAPGATPVAPRIFKSKLARFAPQFSGFNQHDIGICCTGVQVPKWFRS